MNNRESSIKASKNQHRVLVEERVAMAKKKAEPEPLTAEEQAEADANLSANTRLQTGRNMIVSAHEVITAAEYGQARSEQQHGMCDVPYDDLDLLARY